MNGDQMKRWLKKQGCTFETHRRGSGHLTVRRVSAPLNCRCTARENSLEPA